jgi:hypothetical protein
MMTDKACVIFQSLVEIRIGDGKNVLLWNDLLSNGRATKEIVHVVIELVTIRRKNCRWAVDTLTKNKWLKDASKR